jgi:glycine cleavage system aminomethyltransferase T
MPADTTALRYRVAISRPEHIAVVEVTGEDAFAVLDRVVPRELFLRDGQILHTLLLEDDGSPAADLMVCRSDETYLLVAEGLSGAAIVERLRTHAFPGAAFTPRDLGPTHGLVAVDGPYAWELLAEVLGPDVIGLPYLGLFPLQGLTCLRSGKTGEYGYLLLGEHERLPVLWDKLWERGAAFDVGQADLETLDQCALENGFFNIRREGSLGQGPIELQLQWRVSYQKEFAGSQGLRARRQQGAKVRLTAMVSEHALGLGDELWLEAAPVGKIVNAGWSSTRGDFVALALVERAFAYPGLVFRVGAGPATVRTVSPPVINNRSLYVHPQRHSYRTRELQNLPPLLSP